mgnify:CR=1 FL=1
MLGEYCMHMICRLWMLGRGMIFEIWNSRFEIGHGVNIGATGRIVFGWQDDNATRLARDDDGMDERL